MLLFGIEGIESDKVISKGFSDAQAVAMTGSAWNGPGGERREPVWGADCRRRARMAQRCAL